MRDSALQRSDGWTPGAENVGLHVEGLRFEHGPHRLIDTLNLSLGAEGITVVMGPNGAGKSVLLRLLHGLIAPSAGHISWNGVRLDPEVAQRHALVFQKPVLLRRSVAANIDFLLHARGIRDPDLRRKTLERVGLQDMSHHPARRLSGGEQQRLALARALVTSPEVLMLDEPTANLDPAAVQLIERIVKDSAARGTKILFVTHDIGQARRLADDVVFLHKGRLTEHSRADRFFDAPESAAAESYLAGEIIT